MNELPNYQQETCDAVESAWIEVCVDAVQRLVDSVCWEDFCLLLKQDEGLDEVDTVEYSERGSMK